MSRVPQSRLGRQLWHLLPPIYRERDNGELCAWIDACGQMLDGLHGTLEQRLADAFPDTAQSWILPYLAQLLDARLVSPSVDGRRRETQRAVRWRKRKGTVSAVEEIAAAVADSEARVHEGWQRVVTTYRPGHPTPAAMTPDFRRPMREAIDAEGEVTMRHPDGVPCFPGSCEDVTRRTAEITGSAGQGRRFHPRAVLVHLPVGEGFFPLRAAPLRWPGLPDEADMDEPETQVIADRHRVLVRRWRQGELFIETRTEVVGDEVRAETCLLAGTGESPLPIRGRVHLELPDDGVARRVVARHLIFLNTLKVEYARLSLERCAASRALVVHAPAVAEPVLSARDCLLGYARAALRVCRLEYVTVLHGLLAESLQASDSILLGPLRADLDPAHGPPRHACLRYSCVPSLVPYAAFHDGVSRRVYRESMVAEAPVMRSRRFGEDHCGVLHAGVLPGIARGAEDGGEMGAYHHRHHCLRLTAVAEKLRDHLPLGMRAVVVTDPRTGASRPRLRDDD